MIPQGYQATSGEWIVLTPNLELEGEEWDPETASHAGAYQTKALLKWSEYPHRQFRR